MDAQSSNIYAQWMSCLDEEILRPQRLVLATTPSGPIFVRKGDIIGDCVIEQQHWDYHVYRVITEEVSESGTAIDVGAQFGVLSCAMAKKFDKVVSFEPNFESFKVLVLNTLIRPNITPINMCAYDAKTYLSLSRPEEQDIEIPRDEFGHLDFVNTNNVGSYSFSEDGTGLNGVPSIRIDDLNLDRVSFIKVDAQGADGRVIVGAQATIEKHRPIVVFEWEKHLSANYGLSFDELTAFFSEHRYRIDVLAVANDKQTDYIARPL